MRPFSTVSTVARRELAHAHQRRVLAGNVVVGKEAVDQRCRSTRGSSAGSASSALISEAKVIERPGTQR